MSLTLRRSRPDDAAATGDICYRAFKTIAEAHNFLPDFPSPEVAAELLSGLIRHDKFFDLVAESDGRIAGSNFLDERNSIAGIGPITIDPDAQNSRAGHALMQAVLERAREQGFAGIRLVQAGYHNRSLALYLKLGFEVREHLSCLQGPAIAKTIPGCKVRPALPADLAGCNALCLRVHGHHRGGELADAIQQGTAKVVERTGRITGYSSSMAFFGHSMGETVRDLQALISAAEAFAGPGILVPTRNAALFRWCLENGLRVVHPMTLMSMGMYQEPAGSFLPSVLY